MSKYNTESGRPEPLGASCDGQGTNFALFSENAEGVDLLIFEPENTIKPADVIKLKEKTGSIWHCYVHGVTCGYLYAYRVHGPFEPEKGYRFNPSKVLLDPYARAIAGILKWDDYLLGYRADDYYQDLSYSDRDSCPYIPKCLIVDPSFDWENDRRPDIPWNRTVIYETHVKGMTILHPGIEEKKRGTYAGLASPEVINYLKGLGITAVELLPVHHSMDERALFKKHFTNYWGYNPVGFFAPDPRYSSSGFTGGQVREFREMVKSFHRAGMEVIIDAVFNHTAEGDELGPTVSLRGIDNLSYYHLDPKKQGKYLNFTGCGNSVNLSHPAVRRLVLDCLRYWVEEMHIDGFRFDLAVTLARGKGVIDDELSFFKEVSDDPVLSKVKLIAEPWDIGEGGYALGKFPPRWSEWNDKYRDTIRRFWKGDNVKFSDIAQRIGGSPDIFRQNRTSPAASVNYITAHDGFTLNDLVSYNYKHNIFNKESDRDGTNENYSWNSGEEGVTENRGIMELRERRKRNFIATLLLSQGVPMMLHGDEIGRTQRGNNNAYCQDNRITWVDWEIDQKRRDLLEFTKIVIMLRDTNPVFRRGSFFSGQKAGNSNLKDVIWIKPDSGEINDYEWNNTSLLAFGVFLNGEAADDAAEKNSSFLICLNACHADMNFILPGMGQNWELVLYTLDAGKTTARVFGRGENFCMAVHSLAVFKMI